ncbi:MAG: DUF6682 family protein [Mizugakiibacter sp.]|uniref:DUF6682 family protein n=1 Tax=Mizugakiibacter sp. TaxID=1972610 RepID=UPI00320DB1AA
MPLKLSSPISIARGILNDTDAGGYRYSDADLLQYANDALDVMVGIVPQLFYQDIEYTCTANQAEQALSFGTYRALVDVLRIKGGGAVTRGDRTTLDDFKPGWRLDASGPAQDWMKVDDDPIRFLIQPPAPNGQILICKVVPVPAEYLATDDTGLPNDCADMIADYIVARAESRDAEHVISQRAQMFGQSFISKLAPNNQGG